MRDVYRVLADAVLAFHLIWWYAVVVGIYLSWRHPKFRPVHIALVAATVLADTVFHGCPLAMVENAFLSKCDPGAMYEGSFTCHYLQVLLGIHLETGYFFAALAVLLTLSLAAWFHPRECRTG